MMGELSVPAASSLLRVGAVGFTDEGAARFGRRMLGPHARPAAPLRLHREEGRREAAQMSHGLKRWAVDAVSPVAAVIEARVGRAYQARRSATSVLCDCMCAFDSLAAGGAGLAAFSEIVAFVTDAGLPWPEELVDYARDQDLRVLGRREAHGHSGFADGMAAIRVRLIDHIRAVAVSDVLCDAESNEHLSGPEYRVRLREEFGIIEGDALYSRLLAEYPAASPLLREAAGIAADRLLAWRRDHGAEDANAFPSVSASGEAVYRSAVKVWRDLAERTDPDGDLNVALHRYGSLSPGPYYVARPATLLRLGLQDLASFSEHWIRPTGPQLPPRNW